MIGLIMAGGSGKRFWPLSREKKPKQFLRIFSDKSMIQLTYDRLLNLNISNKKIFVVTTENQVPLVKKHLPKLPEKNIIVEPFGRNTAPCIALSLSYFKTKFNKREQILVVPADHIIICEEKFMESIKLASNDAIKDHLITFGIKPTYPATGYGYIESGKKICKNTLYVEDFKEKPNFSIAKSFLNKGNYYWNSGMFFWELGTIIEYYKSLQPKIYDLMQRLESCFDNSDYEKINRIYREMPKIPVDIGIMEKADLRAVIPVDYSWSDVGSWKSLFDISDKDSNFNVINNFNLSMNSSNNLVISDKNIVLIDVSDLVVVDSKDSILISDINSTQKVKKVTKKLKENNKEELL